MNVTPLPALDWPEYQQIVSRRDTLAADLHAAQQEVERLRRTRGQAERADEDARAAALIAGQKDPGKKITEKHAADLAAVEDRVTLLARAVATQDAAALALVKAEPERARDAAESEAAAAGQTYLTLVAAVAEARAAFHAARRAATWTQDPSVKYKPTAVPGLTVRGLTTANGDPADVGMILNALTVEVTGDDGLVDGPWRGTRIPREDAVRMVHRVRAEFSDGGLIIGQAHYAIPADQVPADDAARQAQREAQERRQEAKTRDLMAQQAEDAAPAQPAAAAAAVGADPLADLR